MSRISYSEDEDYPGQFDLWQANCRRSLRGKQGQEELRILRDALLALPGKRLIHGSLATTDGEVCAIGAYARHKGLNLAEYDPEYETDEVGIAAGMPALVAWKVVEMNDEHLGRYYAYTEGRTITMTPEKRYEGMLAWVEAQIRPSVSATQEPK